MKQKNIFKKGLILLGAYLLFALYLIFVTERVERLNKIYHERNSDIATINVSK